MAKYAGYGQLDDRIIDESEIGFKGFNNRIRPDQLGQGILAYSQNGRIDVNGEWRPRGGIDNVSSPFIIPNESFITRLPTANEITETPAQDTVCVFPYTIRQAAITDQGTIIDFKVPGASNINDSVIKIGDEVQIEGLRYTMPVGSSFTLSGHWDPDANGVYVLVDPGEVWQKGNYRFSFSQSGDGSFVFFKSVNSVTQMLHTSPAYAKNEQYPWQVLYGNDQYSGKDFSGTFSNFTWGSTDPSAYWSPPNTIPGQTYTVSNLTFNSGTGIFSLSINSVLSATTVQLGVGLTLPFNLSVDSVVYGVEDSASIGKRMELSSTASATSVVCSTTWSDPSTSRGSYIIMATQVSVSYYNTETGETGTIALPANETIPNNSSMLQAFNKVFIFREGQAALEWDGNFENDFTLVESGEFTQPSQIICDPGEFYISNNIATVLGDRNVKVGQEIEILSPGDIDTGLGVGERYTVSRTYEAGDPITIQSASGPTLQISGEYEDMYKFEVTTLTNHGFTDAEGITISGATGNNASLVNKSNFVAEVLAPNRFVFYFSSNLSNPSITLTGASVSAATGFSFFIQPDSLDSHVDDGITLISNPILTKRVPGSGTLGYTHMPAPEFAVYHQRRLAMPFKYTVDTASTGQYTYRNVVDEIIFSDILDSDTYDQIYGQFRFNAGTSDYLVGLHSFSDDKLVVFNRNSIHIVQTTGAVSNFRSQLITNEVGCVARNSIVQIGSNLLFLSDNGIYGVNFQDLYNLRGNEVPLSESINPVIKTINKDSWDKSSAVYFDNKYYIAVPVGTSENNNTILVFNFLNKQWESVDTVNDPEWDILDLIVAGSGNERGVFAVSSTGSLHKLDGTASIDRVATAISAQGEDPVVNERDIDAKMVTRQFTMANIGRKRWHEFEIHAESNDFSSSDFNINFIFENPDYEGSPKRVSSIILSAIPVAEDISIRGRIGNQRSYGLQFVLDNFLGSPKIRALQASGSASFRSITKAI